MDLLSVCMTNVRKGQQELNESSLIRSNLINDAYNLQAVTNSDNQSRVSRSIQILSKFIEQFEGLKDNLSKKGEQKGGTGAQNDPEIKVVIQNQVSQS